ncbi:MAG TPA: DUF4157 domain-containing protein [Kofleriaceae bacterium]|nr:DUF4157 domain-containing protein [Kofleriaceae bacterium]
MAFDYGRDRSNVAEQAQQEGPVPGKETLTDNLAGQFGLVQRKAATTTPASYADIHAAAARGVQGPETAMPHADTIQRSFGSAADVGSIKAHVGGAAAEGAGAMGATAFATGDHVAFASQPDLHTAAHEAAHVVQQRQGVQLYGGVGQAGDTHEQHADAVADRVVAGQSAADLLAGVGGGGLGGGVQRKIAAPIVQMKGGSGGEATGGAQGAHAPAPAAQGGGEAAPAAAAAAGGAIAAAGGAEAKVARLHLMAFIEAPAVGLKELKAGEVGHTWIAIEYIDPAKVPDSVNPAHKDMLKTGGKYSDPMGFWPAINEGIYYSPNPFKSYVKGWMRHPDDAHQGQEQATQTWELNQREVDAVIAYAESKRGAQYSVFFFNCTTFGYEAVKAAGKSPPSAGTAGVMLPNALYNGIKKRQEQGVGNTEVKNQDGSNEHVVHGTEQHDKSGRGI